MKRGNGEGGPGWGGPAKGAGKPMRTVEEANAIKEALPPEVKDGKAERKEATREMMLAVYERVAGDIAAPALAQITAATHWLNRVEGMPLQTSLVTADLNIHRVLSDKPMTEAEWTEANGVLSDAT